MDKPALIKKMWELAEPIAAELNLTIWDIQFVTEGGERYLRFFIDREGGVFISDCEAFHKRIDPVLDEHDPIDTAYMLEVSSPGIGRTLSCTRHFEQVLNAGIIVKLFKPENGQKQIKGRLVSVTETDITLDINGTARVIERSAFSKAALDDEIVF